MVRNVLPLGGAPEKEGAACAGTHFRYDGRLHLGTGCATAHGRRRHPDSGSRNTGREGSWRGEGGRCKRSGSSWGQISGCPPAQVRGLQLGVQLRKVQTGEGAGSAREGRTARTGTPTWSLSRAGAVPVSRMVTCLDGSSGVACYNAP